MTAEVVTTGKRTAFVPGNQGTFDGRWHGSGLATDIQRFSVLIFTDNHRMTITTQSFDTERVRRKNTQILWLDIFEVDQDVVRRHKSLRRLWS
jgi:hypothetical protein